MPQAQNLNFKRIRIEADASGQADLYLPFYRSRPPFQELEFQTRQRVAPPHGEIYVTDLEIALSPI
jgi:hypothetical protein